jgi:WD40 repeat protein
MPGPAVGGVFISYRRQESSGISGRLYDRLVAHFGDDQVFMDVDAIALGVDFTQVIAQAVSNCTVLLAVIGPGWLTATDEDGQRRLEDPDDIVRLEIQTALERDIRVIPILVEGAVMPRRRQLPEELTGLARRNAIFLRHESFRPDADRLLAAIEPILASAGVSLVASGTEQVVPVVTDPADVAPRTQTVLDSRPAPHVPARLVETLTGHKAQVWDVAFSPDGHLLASCGADETVRVWEVAAGTQMRTLTSHGAEVSRVAFSPDGRLLASVEGNLTVRLSEVATGAQVRTLTSAVVNDAAFSPDGTLLASTNKEAVQLWKVAAGTEVRTLRGHTSYVVHVAFSPDGTLLASTDARETVRVWEVATGERIHTVTGHREGFGGVAFSPDGRLLAFAGADKTVRVWDVATWAEIHTLTGHTKAVNGVAFSPDGRLLASAADDKTVRVWEVTTGKKMQKLTGHTDLVMDVAFSPDGTLLASVSMDKTIRLWG